MTDPDQHAWRRVSPYELRQGSHSTRWHSVDGGWICTKCCYFIPDGYTTIKSRIQNDFSKLKEAEPDSCEPVLIPLDDEYGETTMVQYSCHENVARIVLQS